MTILISFLMFIIVMSSFVITLIAIIQILSNDFKGSKGLWVFISLIGIVGPILYLVHGRKLIVKQSRQVQRIDNSEVTIPKVTFKQIMQSLNVLTILCLVIGVALIIYGKVVRAISYYFFWESKPIGYFVLLVGIIGIIAQLIKLRKEHKLKNVWFKILIGIIVFILFVKTLLLIIMPNSKAYKVSKEFIEKNEEIKKEMGEIKGITILPRGGIQVSGGSDSKSGAAQIEVIIKGSKKYMESIVVAEKQPDTDWYVIGIKYKRHANTQ